MRGILSITLVFGLFSINYAQTLEEQAFTDEDGSVFSDSDFGDEAKNAPKNEHTDKMIFLDAVQKHFWNPNRKLKDNTLNILHRDGETHKIRTRFAMVTTIVLDNDTIADVIVGDPNGFEVKELSKTNNRWNLNNVVTIKPKLIGIDSNLIIIGESGTIYTFYLFSTHFTNRRDPAFMVFVSKNRNVGRIPIKEHKSGLYARGNVGANENNGYISGGWNEDGDERKIPFATIEQDDGEFITIGDKVNTLYIDKTKIKRGYAQKPRSVRSWRSLWLNPQQTEASIAMMAVDIFNDNDYTYFKFDRENAHSKFPVIFKVVDGYDNPVNTRVVGNYIIAEDVNEKWTLKIGDEYVCVQRIQRPLVIKEKEYIQMPAVQDSSKTNGGNDMQPRELEELIRAKEQKLKELQNKSKETKKAKKTAQNTKENKKEESNVADIFKNIPTSSPQAQTNAAPSKPIQNTLIAPQSQNAIQETTTANSANDTQKSSPKNTNQMQNIKDIPKEKQNILILPKWYAPNAQTTPTKNSTNGK